MKLRESSVGRPHKAALARTKITHNLTFAVYAEGISVPGSRNLELRYRSIRGAKKTMNFSARIAIKSRYRPDIIDGSRASVGRSLRIKTFDFSIGVSHKPVFLTVGR